MSLISFLSVSVLVYFFMKKIVRQWTKRQDSKDIHRKGISLPRYYGWYSVLWVVIPLFIFIVVQSFVEKTFFLTEESKVFIGLLVALFLGLLGIFMGRRALVRRKCVRTSVEKVIQYAMLFLTTFVLLVIVLILSVLIVEAMRFFSQVPFFNFIFGMNWAPNDLDTNIIHNFGALPLFLGTFLITILALSVTVPLGVMAAICLSEYAKPSVRSFLRPILESMAGIPTVVYGFFAAIIVAPIFQNFAISFGWEASAQSALAAGMVLGLMLIPMLTSLCVDVLNAVPNSLREASLGLGATKAETIIKVVLPIAKPGLISALLLTFSRAIGETMLVVMAAGLAANLTVNPFSSVTTVTVQIVSLLTGDQQFDTPGTLSAFALGFVLFFITLGINFLAERFQKKVQI